MQNSTDAMVPAQETFSARVAMRVNQEVDALSSFLTRCGKPKTTDD